MLTKKQKLFLELIVNYYNKTKEMPTTGILKKIGNFKSYNSVYKYLNELEKKNYLSLNKKLKKIIYVNSSLIFNNKIIKVPIINEKQYIEIISNHNQKSYLAFKVNNSKLKKYFIKQKDILIIEECQKQIANNLVLAFIENHYDVFMCTIINYYIKLENSNETYIIKDINLIIGKVKTLIRNIN